MLFELIIFAVVLVALQTGMAALAYHVLMRKYLSKETIKEYSIMAMEVAKEISDEMEEDF